MGRCPVGRLPSLVPVSRANRPAKRLPSRSPSCHWKRAPSCRHGAAAAAPAAKGTYRACVPCVSSTAREIRNFPAYLLACLYHAPESYALAQAVPPYSPPCEDRRPTYDLEAYEAMDFLAELRR